MSWRTVLVSVAVTIFTSCASAREQDWVELESQAPDSGQVLRIAGTVHYLDLEGGLFLIRDAEGAQYNPTNLPEAFQHEGMAVEVEARRRDDMASIGMVGPIIEILRLRQRPADTVQADGLWGTSWRLEDLAGAGVIDTVQATLEFSEEGTVTGNGSCNRFHGTVTSSDDTIAFGPLATTRMMCAEAVMNQERQYLDALRDADRFEIEGSFLYIYAAGRPQPLRFIRADESGGRR